MGEDAGGGSRRARVALGNSLCWRVEWRAEAEGRLRDPNEARTRSHFERENGSAADGEISEISRQIASRAPTEALIIAASNGVAQWEAGGQTLLSAVNASG